MELRDIIDLNTFPIDDAELRVACKKEFDYGGVFLMPGFIQKDAIDAIRVEGLANK
ncbi:hypothetical protein [Ruegeria atlantica]|uniref:hypothetical protein n=1 Tax=Ruegeria atlantica TaxID=81569 RepID=UPI0024951509|nr:hypothetical protein [Ruegeria atlantica]